MKSCFACAAVCPVSEELAGKRSFTRSCLYLKPGRLIIRERTILLYSFPSQEGEFV